VPGETVSKITDRVMEMTARMKRATAGNAIDSINARNRRAVRVRKHSPRAGRAETLRKQYQNH
jgi:hypothetical protein